MTAGLAARPDVVVTVRSAYLQGLLVNPDARWPLNAGLDQADLAARIAGLVEELGRESAADLCLAWVLGHPWVTSVVVGAETADQVRDSARLTRNDPLTPEEIAHVAEVLPGRWRRPRRPLAMEDPMSSALFDLSGCVALVTGASGPARPVDGARRWPAPAPTSWPSRGT